MLNVVRHMFVYARLMDLRDDSEGASLAEYALLLGLITGAVVLTIAALSGAIGDTITAVTNLIAPSQDAGTGGTSP